MKTANIIDSYSLPDQRREYLPRLTWRSGKRYSDGRRGDFPVADDGSFSFDVPLDEGAGIYTVVVWVHRRGGDANAISASNVSIRVDAPAARMITGSGILRALISSASTTRKITAVGTSMIARRPRT